MKFKIKLARACVDSDRFYDVYAKKRWYFGIKYWQWVGTCRTDEEAWEVAKKYIDATREVKEMCKEFEF